MRSYLNTKETCLTKIEGFFTEKSSFYFKKSVYYKCEVCNEVKEKRLYPEKVNMGLDFICRECKYKITSMKKYGVDNPTKNKNIKLKTERTCLEKYGVSNPAKNIEIISKIKKNNKAADSKTREKFRKTCIKKYGVDNPAKSDIIKNKTEKTNLLKYGVKAPCQNPNILSKCFKNIEYDSIYFDSSWEVAYYVWCKKHNIDIKRNTQMFELTNGHKCCPDFIVDGQLVEIKGDHLKKQENYKYKQIFYSKNNIKVLSYDDLLPIFKDVYQELVDKKLPLPKIKTKRKIYFVSFIDEIEHYKNINCKIQYVCAKCGAMNITGYKILKHFNNLLCKKCRALHFSDTN